MRVKASNIAVSLDAMLPNNAGQLQREVAKACGIPAKKINDIYIVRKSVDARKKQHVHFVLTCELDVAEGTKLHPAKGVHVAPIDPHAPRKEYVIGGPSAPAPTMDGRYVVVGAGPAGLFCALYLARAGFKPLLVERGEAVEDRARTVADFNNGASLNPQSNIQFGEGGAGTFSDGKLNTGKKDTRIPAVLKAFAECGAPADILVDAKPHIGTDYLPTVVRNLRQQIIEAGGEVLFNTQLVDIDLVEHAPRRVRSATLQNVLTGECTAIPTAALVLAIGHSARDTFEMLRDANIALERKPFAMGVRIEHEQHDINRAQYGEAAGHPALPPADYKLNVRTEDGRGVYTFCMCPGGTVVAAASEPEGVCVNGMSPFARDGKNANSALLVEVHPEDLPGEDVLAGMYFQRELEHAAYKTGMNAAASSAPYTAPAQTVGSFLNVEREPTTAHAQTVGSFLNVEREPTTAHAQVDVGVDTCIDPKPQSHGVTGDSFVGVTGDGSADTESCHQNRPHDTITDRHAVHPTYPRGTAPANLRDCLPPLITDALADALPKLDKKLHGFASPTALMTAVEARSSSPVRIVRDMHTLQSVSASNLYPAGEGAGYAGGITSAAVDGLRIAEAIERAVAIEAAAQALREGRPAIFPTDTVMGIGVAVCAAESPAVLAQIKGRPQDKPIAWLVADAQALDIYGEDVPAYAYELAAEQWPGALTLIVKASEHVPPQFRSATGTIGLRMPNSVTALQLIRATGCPLATTSANLAGDPAPAIPADLTEDFLHCAIDHDAYLLTPQDPAKPAAQPSTIIDCTGSEPQMLR